MQNNLPRFACNVIVYIAVRNKSNIPDSERMLPALFKLRLLEKGWENGISVFSFPATPTIENAHEQTPLKKVWGLGSLHVGKLRDIGFDVIPDPIPGYPNHALIVGMPTDEEDRKGALDSSESIADDSRVVW